ncbi:hypothetical protein [Bradyrhizobium sp. AS23.2]|uniref:hypothetical protein n=1 Tax=Bradyrhizobium sp. AS23.2 TaxID=1680155 RepID=UPI0014317E66|nr:hypothetical protein [Bradyrhizobium sp. AS23.2]
MIRSTTASLRFREVVNEGVDSGTSRRDLGSRFVARLSRFTKSAGMAKLGFGPPCAADL